MSAPPKSFVPITKTEHALHPEYAKFFELLASEVAALTARIAELEARVATLESEVFP